ncbi:ABC transporter permease, partial [Clostridiaceae bacterium]|nr:ABC transporter permease [Clostridiaceae bacterium]
MIKSKNKNGSSSLGVLIALLLLCAVLAIASPNFLSMTNLMNVLKQTAFNALLAIGMLLCLITAGIDLSVGANATFCACMAGMMVQKGMTNSFLMIIVILISGLVVGTVNGLLLTRLHLPHPFVSTLGMKNVLWGLGLIVT